MKLSINPKTNEVNIETVDRPAYCYSCTKYLGRIHFIKGDSITDSTLTKTIPLCYECFKEKIPNPPEIKIV